MAEPILFSLVESPSHPDLSGLYKRHGIREVRFSSMRKAIAALKAQRPDIVVGEFFYGYGNNYAGVNISNLDVFLASLRKYAPDARVIVMVDKAERPHVDKLAALFPVSVVLTHPVGEAAMEQALDAGERHAGGPARL